MGEHEQVSGEQMRAVNPLRKRQMTKEEADPQSRGLLGPPPGYDKWGQRLRNGEDSWAFRNDCKAHQNINLVLDQPERGNGKPLEYGDEIVPMAHWQFEAARSGMKGEKRTKHLANQSSIDQQRLSNQTPSQSLRKSIAIEAESKEKLRVSLKTWIQKVLNRQKTKRIGPGSRDSSSLMADLEPDHQSLASNTGNSFLTPKMSPTSSYLPHPKTRDISPSQASSTTKASSSKMTFRGRVEKYD